MGIIRHAVYGSARDIRRKATKISRGIEAGNRAVVRDRERAVKAVARARIADQKAKVRRQAELAKQANLSYLAARQQTSVKMTDELTKTLGKIDSMLADALSADSYIDLETLKMSFEAPVFTSSFSKPIPALKRLEMPVQPNPKPTPTVKGLRRLFALPVPEKELARVSALADKEQQEWNAAVQSLLARQDAELKAYKDAEEQRLKALNCEKLAHEAANVERLAQVNALNEAIDSNIARLARGDSQAIAQYAELVLSRSKYPHSLEPGSKCSFVDGRLEITMKFPLPSELPKARQYRYVKTNDEIVEVAQSAKEIRDRYSRLIGAMTLRSIYEVLKADRTRAIRTISLIGGVDHLHPGHGRQVFTPLIEIATSRENFEKLNLSVVVPTETLKHLKAAISKNPGDLEPIAK